MSTPEFKRGHERKLSHVQFVKKSQTIQDYASSDFIDVKRHTHLSDITIDNVESQTSKEEDTWIECTHKKQHIGPFQRANHCELFSYLTLVFLAVIFSGQLLLSRELTGEFFELKPFNYMLGPSAEVMVKTGARFPPCMRSIDVFPPNETYVCLKTLMDNPPYRTSMHSLQFAPEPNLNSTCDLMDICSMTGFHQEQKPDQTFRFLTPLFVHAGIIPLFINNMYLIFIGIRVEKVMGSLLYAGKFVNWTLTDFMH
jgi:membrane associated rhomboid family serine protease